MLEPKPLAALTSSLLARKGDARPAIRRAFVPVTPIGRPLPVATQDDLGWNDVGDETNSPARQQQATIRKRISAGQQAASGDVRAAFTLRLDPERHLRLRLASAVDKRSAQKIVIEALDALLANYQGLDALVDEARTVRAK